jgi:opacity protein-like surface antigen
VSRAAVGLVLLLLCAPLAGQERKREQTPQKPEKQEKQEKPKPPKKPREKRFEATGFVGGLSISHDLGRATNLFFTVSGEAESAGFGKYYGARGSYRLTRRLHAEGSLVFSKNDFVSTVQDNELGSIDVGEQFTADQLAFSGNAVYDFPLKSGPIPFATIGFGWARMTPQNRILDMESVGSFDVNLGGGVKYFFNRLIGARFDLRYHLLSEGLAYPGSSASPRQTEFTVGAIVRVY